MFQVNIYDIFQVEVSLLLYKGVNMKSTWNSSLHIKALPQLVLLEYSQESKKVDVSLYF